MDEFNFNKMVSQSRQVILGSSASSFEKYENDGGLKEALIYMTIAAVLTGLLGLGGGVRGLISNIITTLIGFLAFVYLVYFVGKQQGGTGTLDQVAYTFSLFWAPISVLFAAITLVLLITIVGILFIPIVAILALIANIYFAAIATKSSMNLEDQSKIVITLIIAAIGSFAVNIFVGNIF